MRNNFLATMIVLAVATVMATGCGSVNTDTSETKKIQETTAETEGTTAKADDPTTEKPTTEEPLQTSEADEARYYYELGRSYLYGTDGNEIDYETAHANFILAEEMGYTDANFYIGVLYDWYDYPTSDFVAARECYEKCEGNPYAQICLGLLYMNAQGVEEDMERAKELFQSAVDQGCVEGYCGFASIARAENDYATALEYYNKALEGTETLFITSIMNIIGNMYCNGNGVEQDYSKALEWFEKGADLRSRVSMFNVGYMYYGGYGVEQDCSKALVFFEKSADLGYVDSMNYAGDIYYYGIGGEGDYSKALEWYEKGAENGNGYSMGQIGFMYLYGDGVEQDYSKAFEWFEKGTEAGDDVSTNQLGELYYNGLGAEQDYLKALELFEKASEMGNMEGRKNAFLLRDMLGE